MRAVGNFPLCVIPAIIVLLFSSQAKAEAVKWSYTNEYSPRRCLTGCNNYGRDYQWCWVSWQDWAKCTQGDTDLHQNLGKSLARRQCKTTCGKHGGELYNWCFTSVWPKLWDFCVKPEKQIFHLSLTKDGSLCRTKCDPRKSHPTCYYSYSQYDYCNPGDLPIKLPLTDAGHRCSSLCGNYGYSYNWCDTEDNESGWDYCYVSNSIDYLNSLDRQHAKSRSLDNDLSPNIKYLINIKAQQSLQRLLRKYNITASNLSIAGINEMRNIMFSMDSSMISLSNNQNSATRYLRTFTDNGVILVHYIKAKIYPKHVSLKKNIDFRDNEARARMEELNASVHDDVGHLLAASLGGSNEVWNLVPKSSSFTKSGHWSRVENEIQTVVKNIHQPGHYISWELFVRYRGTRPATYVLCYSLRDIKGNSVREFQAWEFHDD